VSNSVQLRFVRDPGRWWEGVPHLDEGPRWMRCHDLVGPGQHVVKEKGPAVAGGRGFDRSIRGLLALECYCNTSGSLFAIAARLAQAVHLRSRNSTTKGDAESVVSQKWEKDVCVCVMLHSLLHTPQRRAVLIQSQKEEIQ